MSENKELILSRLRDKRGQYLSGALLSDEIGVSRAAVWKQVCALRQNGYQISAMPNKGYRLVREPDLLNIEKFDGKSIHYYETVDSTNLTLRMLAEEGAPNYTIVTAEEQTLGRGRLGRSWFSPRAKGLWFSILLRPRNLTPARVAPITLVAAATLANQINNQYDVAIKLKWPNDLLLKGKKAGGILTELKGELDQVEYLIIGIGLNINQQEEDFPKGLRKVATSLHIESGRFLNRTDLLLMVRDNLARAFNLFLSEGFMPFYMPWKKHNVTLGQRVTLSWKGGLLQGKALHLTKEGALQIQDNRGVIHTVNYGELI